MCRVGCLCEGECCVCVCVWQRGRVRVYVCACFGGCMGGGGGSVYMCVYVIPLF